MTTLTIEVVAQTESTWSATGFRSLPWREHDGHFFCW